MASELTRYKQTTTIQNSFEFLWRCAMISNMPLFENIIGHSMWWYPALRKKTSISLCTISHKKSAHPLLLAQFPVVYSNECPPVRELPMEFDKHNLKHYALR